MIRPAGNGRRPTAPLPARCAARPPLIEAQAWSVQTSDPALRDYARGDRVFHQKFGYGRVTFVEGNKLTVEFRQGGRKAGDRPVCGARITNSVSSLANAGDPGDEEYRKSGEWFELTTQDVGAVKNRRFT